MLQAYVMHAAGSSAGFDEMAVKDGAEQVISFRGSLNCGWVICAGASWSSLSSSTPAAQPRATQRCPSMRATAQSPKPTTSWPPSCLSQVGRSLLLQVGVSLFTFATYADCFTALDLQHLNFSGSRVGMSSCLLQARLWSVPGHIYALRLRVLVQFMCWEVSIVLPATEKSSHAEILVMLTCCHAEPASKVPERLFGYLPCRRGFNQAPAVKGDAPGVWLCGARGDACVLLCRSGLGSGQRHRLRAVRAHAADWVLHRAHRGAHGCGLCSCRRAWVPRVCFPTD